MRSGSLLRTILLHAFSAIPHCIITFHFWSLPYNNNTTNHLNGAYTIYMTLEIGVSPLPPKLPNFRRPEFSILYFCFLKNVVEPFVYCSKIFLFEFNQLSKCRLTPWLNAVIRDFSVGNSFIYWMRNAGKIVILTSNNSSFTILAVYIYCIFFRWHISTRGFPRILHS